MKNLYTHIENLKEKFGLNVIVAINRFNTDTVQELEFVQNELKKKNIESSIVESWSKGGEGAIDISEKLIKMCDEKTEIKYSYNFDDKINDKIYKISKEIYRAEGIKISKEAQEKINKIEEMGYSNLPICIAKTQYSFSDDSKNIECNNKYVININNVELKAGAGFIVVYAGNIMTMPGLPKVPAAENIDIKEDGEIVGLF